MAKNIMIDHRIRHENHEMTEKHNHPFYEMYILLDGQRIIRVDDRDYYLKKGDMIFLPKNVMHQTFPVDKKTHERIVLYFNEAALARLHADDWATDIRKMFNPPELTLHFNIPELSEIETDLAQIVREQSAAELSVEACMQAYLTIFLAKIYRYRPNHSLKTENNLSQKILSIQSYIQSYYDHPLSLSYFSEKFDINSSYLSNKFKEYTGYSVVEFIQRTRIHKAQRLLRNTNANITMVSSEVGFSNVIHFGRVFKKYTAYSPSQYRLQFTQKK